MTQLEKNIGVILNSLVVVEAKLDTIIDLNVSREDMPKFNEDLKSHINLVKQKLFVYYGRLDQQATEGSSDPFVV